MSCVQVLGPKTYAGKQMAAVGNHHRGKEVLNIHLLKAAAHEAVAHPRLGLVPCTDDTRPEWVTYPYRNAHPILRWLPSKLAEWLSENLPEELAIPAKRGDKWTVEGAEHCSGEQSGCLWLNWWADQDLWCHSMGV